MTTVLQRSATTIRPRVATAPMALTAVVAVGALVRLVTSFGREAPHFLPDEFLYAQLARSLASGEGVSVLGEPSAFPALLEPLLTSVFWRAGDVEVAMRLTQVLHCFAMGLAAVPVYTLAHRLGLTTRAALAAAAGAVIAPGLVFAGYLTADAIGYLLVLIALDASVRALTTPTRAAQAWFLGAASIATFARIQYALLLPAFAIAALVVERGRLGQALRRYHVVAVALAGGILLAAALGPRALGRYEVVSTFGASASAATWFLSTTLLLAIAAGIAIVPGAVAWLCSQLWRPGTHERAAFAVFAVAFVTLLVAVTSLMTVETSANRFIERYLLVIVPITALAFACWVDEGRPARRIVIVTGAVVIVGVARIPLSGYVHGQGSAESPTLAAVLRLERAIGVGDASLVVALVVTAGCVLALAAAMTQRVRPALVVGFAVGALGAASVGAHAWDVHGGRYVRSAFLPENPSWVDARRPGNVLLVQTADSSRVDAMLAALWNKSVTRAVPLGQERIDPFDGLAGKPIRLRADGTLTSTDGPVREPVLFALGGTAASFANVDRVTYERRFALVVPRDAVRLTMLARGIRFDGKVSPSGVWTVWPTSDGRCTSLTVRLTLPKGVPPTTLSLWSSDGSTRRVKVTSQVPATVNLISRPSAKRTLRYRTVRLGSSRPRPFVVTVANARYTSKSVTCAA